MGHHAPGNSLRLVGLDVGDQRVGVAVSDPTGSLASPVGVFRRRDITSDVRHVAEVVREHEAGGVVLGLPKNMDGTEGFQAAKTREFAAALQSHGLEIDMWDERLSSIEVTRRMTEQRHNRRRIKELRDSHAAALILQTYLDHLRLKAQP